jgi:hypothetical protein
VIRCFQNLIFIGNRIKVSHHNKTILLNPMVVIPHQSASQTASPKGSLKKPDLCHSCVDNTNINIRKS